MQKAVKIKPGKLFLSSSELAERWGISKKTVLRKIHRGDIEGYEIGGKFVVRLSDVSHYEKAARV